MREQDEGRAGGAAASLPLDEFVGQEFVVEAVRQTVRELSDPHKAATLADAAELFFFYGRYNQLIQPPLFLEYSSGWVDASTFTVTVINGTEPSLDLLDPNYVPGFTLGVDPLVRVALRPGVEVVPFLWPRRGCRATPNFRHGSPMGRSQFENFPEPRRFPSAPRFGKFF